MKVVQKNIIVYIALLVTVGVAVYSGSINAPFYLDDETNVIQSESVQLSDMSKEGLASVFKKSKLVSRPVANISFALNYYFFGYSLVGFHAVNIIIHILSGIFLFQFLVLTFRTPVLSGRYSNATWLAFASALIWLVHPVQTQAVTYIVQRMTSLSAMFYILSMMCYAYGRLTVSSFIGVRGIWFSGSFVAALLAFGSKEIAVTLPVFILLYEWFFFQELSRKFLRVLLPYLLGTVIVSVIIYTFNRDALYNLILSGYEFRDFTLVERLMTESRVILFYLGLLLFPYPSRLSLERDFELSTSLISPLTTLSSIMFLLSILAVACIYAKRYRLLSFVIFWFLGNLVLESSLIPLELFFEHRLYLPSMLFFIAVPLFMDNFFKLRWARNILMALLVAVLSLWTYTRNNVWGNPILFHQNNITHSPGNYRVYNNFGFYYLGKGDFVESIKYLLKSLELNSENIPAHKNIAFSYMMTGQYDLSLNHYLKVLVAFPRDPQINYYIGVVFKEQGEIDKSIMRFSNVLRLYPDHVRAHLQLANLYSVGKQFDKAIEHFKEVLRISGQDNFEILVNLGNCYANLEVFDKAIETYLDALRIRPSHEMVKYNINLAKQRLKEKERRTH